MQVATAAYFMTIKICVGLASQDGRVLGSTDERGMVRSLEPLGTEKA